MITIMKKYNSPMLNVVSIKATDIVTASDVNASIGNNVTSTSGILAPGHFRDFEWYGE